MSPRRQFILLCTLFTISIICLVCIKIICGSNCTLANLVEWPLTMIIFSIIGLVCYMLMMAIFIDAFTRRRRRRQYGKNSRRR